MGYFFYIKCFWSLLYYFSNIIAYIIATINSYIWNSLWVFKYGQGLDINTSVKFFILNLVGLTANTTIMYILVHILNLNKFIALVIASVLVVIMNYTINKLWVFKEENNAFKREQVMSAIIGFINLNGENINEAIGNDMVEKLNIYKLDSIKTMKKK